MKRTPVQHFSGRANSVTRNVKMAVVALESLAGDLCPFPDFRDPRLTLNIANVALGQVNFNLEKMAQAVQRCQIVIR